MDVQQRRQRRPALIAQDQVYPAEIQDPPQVHQALPHEEKPAERADGVTIVHAVSYILSIVFRNGLAAHDPDPSTPRLAVSHHVRFP